MTANQQVIQSVDVHGQFPSPNTEALVGVRWSRVLFLHFAVEPDVVRTNVPLPFELELFENKAIVSLVALTKSHFRPAPGAPLWTRLLPLVSEQRLFNLRTYVRYHDEPGAFFFWSWLSRPWGLPLPDRPLDLTCAFATSRYEHHHEAGELRGQIKDRSTACQFAYGGQIDPETVFTPCPPGSLVDFALERYTGYFWYRGAGRVFRAWHPAWLQSTVQIEIQDSSLVTQTFPWLRQAEFLEATYAPGFKDVWIGRPRVLSRCGRTRPRHHHGASAFFEMP